LTAQYIAGRFKAWGDNGDPLATARLYTYENGTTTHKNAFTTAALNTPVTYTSDGAGGLFVPMNARGEALLWLGTGVYTLTLKTALGAVIWTDDDQSNEIANFLLTLAGAIGSTIIGWIQAGANAILRTLQAKVRERVSAADFSGYDPTGVSDSQAAITSAFTSLGAAGGTVYINNGDKVLIDNNLTVPKNCHLVGPHMITGTPGGNASAPYGNVGGAIYLNSTKTITLESSASVSGLYILRKGMTFPAQDATAYAGTVFNADGDDCKIANLLVIGFKKVYTTTFHGRLMIDRVLFDCNPDTGDGAIDIDGIYDAGQIQYTHGWPFGTIEAYSTAISGGSTAAVEAYRLHRTGAGYKIRSQADAVSLHSAFSYAYNIGFDIDVAGGFQFTGGCWADNTRYYTGSIGFKIRATTDTTADQLRTYGCDYGCDFDLSTESKFTAAIMHAQYCNYDALIIGAGDYCIGTLVAKNNGGAAINITSNAARLRLENLIDTGNTYANPVKLSVSLVRIEDCDIGGVLSDKADGTSLVGTNDTAIRQIASATTINVPTRPDIFYILGTTNIETINGVNGGRVITFIFQGSLTVKNGTGNIHIGADFVTNARSCLQLVGDPYAGGVNGFASRTN
jgi:hypothetical protein